MWRYFLPALLFLIFSVDVCAQSFYTLRRDRSLIFVAGLNSSTYYGDLKDYSDFLDAKPSLSLGLKTGVNRRLYVRGEFSWITLSGEDRLGAGSGREGRNLSFHSSNYEFSVSGLWHLVPYAGRFYQRPNLNAYAFIGVGGLYFNPKTTLDGREYALQPLHTEGVEYSRLTFVVPFGIGGTIKLTPFVNASVDVGWRKTFTDYIDDVSTKHIDVSTVSDPIRKRLADRRPELGLPPVPPGYKRGNPDKDDAYMLLSVNIEYYLPFQLGQQRPTYRRRRQASSR